MKMHFLDSKTIIFHRLWLDWHHGWGDAGVHLQHIWGFPKMVVPNNHGFSYYSKNDHFGAFGGYQHLRKRPYTSTRVAFTTRSMNQKPGQIIPPEKLWWFSTLGNILSFPWKKTHLPHCHGWVNTSMLRFVLRLPNEEWNHSASTHRQGPRWKISQELQRQLEIKYVHIFYPRIQLAKNRRFSWNFVTGGSYVLSKKNNNSANLG